MSEAQGGAANTAQAQPTQQNQVNPKQNPQGGQPNPAQAGATQGKAPQAVSEAAKEAMRKLKVKYDDGAEEEVDEEVVLKTYKERTGHQKAANKILQEGKARSKQAEMFLSMLKDETKVLDVLKAVGYDDQRLRKLSENYLVEKIKFETLDPLEQRAILAEQRVKNFEDLEKKQKQEAQKRYDEEAKRKFSEKYTQEFTEALGSTKVPATKETVAMMAKYISIAAKGKIEMTPLEAAKLVKEDLVERQRALLMEAQPETLAELLGDDTLSKIRAHDVERLKNPQSFLKTPSALDQGDVKRQSTEPRKKMTRSEWRKFNRS